MSIKRGIKFELQTRTEGGVPRTDNLPIRMRISFSGERIDIRVGFSIDLDQWNVDTSRMKPKTKNKYGQSASEINREIANYLNMAEDIFARFDLDKITPTPKLFMAAFNDVSGRKKVKYKTIENSVYTSFDVFVYEMGRQNSWTKATYTKFETLKRHLQDFAPEFYFYDLTEEKLRGFVKSLHDHGLRNTTISKYLGFLRWFLRWCANNGKYSGTLHESFKPKLKGTDGNIKEIIHLTWDELISLYNFKFPANRSSLSLVRDVFCFTCFTGLRYSDVKNLKRSDVKKDHLSVVTIKTSDSLKIDLNKYSRAILDKYSDIFLSNNRALPVISNVKMNVYLKEMGEIAGINEPQRVVYFLGSERHEEVHPKYALLTTHCGRRTFIVTSLTLGIPAEVVMRFTGHSDYNAMKPYVKIVDDLKKREMSKFDTAVTPGKEKPQKKGSRKSTQKLGSQMNTNETQ